jgi:dihydroxy-acid dehydratase
MEDFHAAGGVPTLMKALVDRLDQSAVAVDGRSVGEILERVEPPQQWQNIIGSLDRPIGPAGTLVVLRGSLVPNGAVLKKAAACAELLRHTGPAVVLDGADDAAARLDALGASITKDHVLVVRGVGPIAAGMPEAGSVPIPRALAERGVKDMVRITDGRMSGTAYGTVILHASPEAAAGGPLALVEDGDMIELDVAEGRLDLKVDEAQLARRRSRITPYHLPRRGWRRLYADHVLQADEGADLDFLL